MNSKRFWNFVENEETAETELLFYGPIASETWLGDEITPGMFRDELSKVSGNLTVWLSSPGGDVFAASQIYAMLKNHKGKVTVKIDGIAASAASVVAMAGDETLIAPSAVMMIHDPSTVACGNKEDMKKAIAILDEVKECIINAYTTKTNLSRDKIAKMMSDETWLNANKALEMGFVDGILFADNKKAPNVQQNPETTDATDRKKYMMFSQRSATESLVQKISAMATPESQSNGVPVAQLRHRLEIMKH